MQTLSLIAALSILLPGSGTSPECHDTPVNIEQRQVTTRTAEAPAGRVADYAADSYYFMYSPAFGVQYMLQTETACQIVFDDANNTVYLNRIFGGLGTSAWLKGVREGDEVTFSFPQAIDSTEEGTRYAALFRMGNDETGLTYNISPDETLTMTIDADGTLRAPSSGNCEVFYPSFILGLTEPTDDIKTAVWAGYGDANMVYAPFNDETLPVPDDLNWEPYALEHYSYVNGTDRTEFHRTQAQVAFADGLVYMRGLCKYMPDAVIKGKVGDGKVTFPTHQYIGVGLEQYVYLECAPFENVYDSKAGHYVPTLGEFEDYLTFSYDPERRRMSNAESALVFSCAQKRLYYLQYIVAPKLQGITANAEPERPANPIVNHSFPYQGGNLCYGYFTITLPDYDINGTPLSHDDLYYEVYFNGSATPFTFANGFYTMTEDYYGGPMTQVPYDFTDYFNFTNDGAYTFEVSYYDPTVDTIGVRLFYTGKTGELLMSDLVTNYDRPYKDDPASDPEPDDVSLEDLGHTSDVAVIETTGEKAVAGRYNLMGMPVGDNYKGIQIIVFTDGTTAKNLRR